jgi:hypothetical protein
VALALYVPIWHRNGGRCQIFVAYRNSSAGPENDETAPERGF